MNETYPIAVKEIHIKVRQIIETLFPSGKGLLALDAASGNGYMSEWLNEKGFEITALDKSTNIWRVDGVKCSYADLDQDLKIKNSIFDLTISIETIEHLENPFHFIRELSRVTKDNGVIIISTPNTHSIRSRLKYLFCGMPVLFECIKNDNMGQHITPISMGQFLYAFGRTGVKLTDVFSVGSKSRFMVKKTLALLNWFTLGGTLMLRHHRRFDSDHYLNVLSRKQLKELNNDLILIIVAQKK